MRDCVWPRRKILRLLLTAGGTLRGGAEEPSPDRPRANRVALIAHSDAVTAEYRIARSQYALCFNAFYEPLNKQSLYITY